MATLLLRFDSPLQSWGTTLKLKNHETGLYPSKSGVVGMIASALGRSREDDISDLAALKFGVRTDKQGSILHDFQVSFNPDTGAKKIGYRDYLEDAIFTCGLECSRDMAEQIQEALLYPARQLYAGRRSCPVTPDLVQGITDLPLLDALKQREDDSDHAPRTIVIDAEDGMLVKDVPISFSSEQRQYAYRFVNTIATAD